MYEIQVMIKFTRVPHEVAIQQQKRPRNKTIRGPLSIVIVHELESLYGNYAYTGTNPALLPGAGYIISPLRTIYSLVDILECVALE